MHHSRYPRPDEVEQLLRNAELRDELERYFDESISRVNVQQWTLAAENEFLASMLAWEQCRSCPFTAGSSPKCGCRGRKRSATATSHQILWDVIGKLFAKRIVLDFTDHLSDRELYRLIYCDILPAREKKLDYPSSYLHWDCTGAGGDSEVWLRYYASQEERQEWAESYRQPLPPRTPPPYPRNLPREPGNS